MGDSLRDFGFSLVWPGLRAERRGRLAVISDERPSSAGRSLTFGTPTQTVGLGVEFLGALVNRPPSRVSTPQAASPAPIVHTGSESKVLHPAPALPIKSVTLPSPGHGVAILTQTISTLAPPSAVADVIYSSAWQAQTVPLMAETAAMHVNPATHATHT